jgi:hypothetical protein
MWLNDSALCHTDPDDAKKLNNFIAINVSGLYLAGRQAPSSITERKIYG